MRIRSITTSKTGDPFSFVSGEWAGGVLASFTKTVLGNLKAISDPQLASVLMKRVPTFNAASSNSFCGRVHPLFIEIAKELYHAFSNSVHTFND